MQKGILILLGLLVLPAFGEFRIWQDTRGTSIEAEYIGEQSGRIVLKTPDGKTLRVKPESLSEADQYYANLQIKPKLVVDVDEMEVRKTDPAMPLVFLNEVKLEATIQKKNTRPYKGELTATFIFLGDHENSKHEIIVRKDMQKFELKKENILTSSAPFARKSSGWLKSEHHAYEGYLLVITDPFGSIVEVVSAPSSYERFAEKILALKEGAEFDRNFTPVDLNIDKIERAEAAEPKCWLYAMGEGEFGFPRKSSDGIIARIYTRNEEANLFHYRVPIDFHQMAERNAVTNDVDVVVHFKLTNGRIGVANAYDNFDCITVQDDAVHVLEIKTDGPEYTFRLDGVPVQDVQRDRSPKRSSSWKLYARVEKKARLEIISIEYQD